MFNLTTGSWSKVGKVPIFMDKNFDMGLLAGFFGPCYFHPSGFVTFL